MLLRLGLTFWGHYKAFLTCQFLYLKQIAADKSNVSRFVDMDFYNLI